jgi:hypothetical protein
MVDVKWGCFDFAELDWSMSGDWLGGVEFVFLTVN